MNKKFLPTDKNTRMAAQIEEIYNRLSLIEDLLTDLSPALEKITKETHNTVKELRERFERDETIALLKKVGDNIPTFVELLNVMEAVKGLLIDVAPAIGKITKEVTPSINMFRESLEKDEALQLLKKTGENINAFNKLLDFLKEFDRSGTLDFTLMKISTKETEYILKGMLGCLSKAMQEIASKPPQPGIRNLLSAIRDAEVQKGILLMTIFARYLPQSLYELINEDEIQQK